MKLADARTPKAGEFRPRPRLSAGDLRADVAPESGGRVAAFWRETGDGRRDILAPLPQEAFAPADWPKAGSYPLVPWSNLIRDARFPANGRTVALRPHPMRRPHALHGVGHELPWTATDRTGDSLTMRLRYDPAAHAQPCWPWAFDAEQTLRLDPLGLSIGMRIANRSAEPMPAGLGVHPFFAAAEGDGLRFAAGAIWMTDATGCAVERRGLSGDAAQVAIAGGSGLTAHYGDWCGVATLLRANGERIIIQASAPFGQLVAHAPAGAAYMCIEPVTHVVDGFNLAARGMASTGVQILASGESRSATMKISVL